jgi:PPOX class probable F420-dependent enzyme
MPKLTDEDQRDFLDEREHLVRLATIDDDGMPRVVPVWFTFRNGSIMFTPRAESVFLANLRRDPRIALSIDEDPLPYRKISVQGTAEIVHDVGNDDEWRDIYREIACRYIDDEAADRYLAATDDQPRALVSVELATARVSTWRMPVDDEPGTGIWARRYYASGSRMAGEP